jgi:hypothetical protein
MIQLNITDGMSVRGFVAANLNLIIALNKNGYKYSYIASQLMNFGVDEKHAKNIKYYVCHFKKELESSEEIAKYSEVIINALKADIVNNILIAGQSQQIMPADKVILTDDNSQSPVVETLTIVPVNNIVEVDDRYEYIMSLFDTKIMDERSRKGLSNAVLRNLKTWHNNDKESLKQFAYSGFKNYEKNGLKFNQ